MGVKFKVFALTMFLSIVILFKIQPGYFHDYGGHNKNKVHGTMSTFSYHYVSG